MQCHPGEHSDRVIPSEVWSKARMHYLPSPVSYHHRLGDASNNITPSPWNPMEFVYKPGRPQLSRRNGSHAIHSKKTVCRSSFRSFRLCLMIRSFPWQQYGTQEPSALLLCFTYLRTLLSKTTAGDDQLQLGQQILFISVLLEKEAYSFNSIRVVPFSLMSMILSQWPMKKNDFTFSFRQMFFKERAH